MLTFLAPLDHTLNKLIRPIADRKHQSILNFISYYGLNPSNRFATHFKPQKFPQEKNGTDKNAKEKELSKYQEKFRTHRHRLIVSNNFIASAIQI